MFSNHRGHGHFIALRDIKDFGFDGKFSAVCKGMGGSQHLHDGNFMGMVYRGVPGVATGIGMGHKLDKNGVSVCFVGDGTFGETNHESMNMASLWELPVLFIVEDNEIAWPMELNRSGELIQRVKGFEIKAKELDGQDVEIIRHATLNAISEIRKTINLRCSSSKPPDFHLILRVMIPLKR